MFRAFQNLNHAGLTVFKSPRLRNPSNNADRWKIHQYKSKAVQNQNLESAEGFCSTVFQLGVCRNFRSPVILSPTIPIPFNFLSCAMLSSNEIGSSVRRRIPWTRQSFLGRWQRWKWRQPMPPIHQRHQLHQSINPLWMMPEEGGILISIVSQIFLIDIRYMQHVGPNKFPASLSSLSPSAVKHPCQLAVPNCDMSWESAKRFNMFNTFQPGCFLRIRGSARVKHWSRVSIGLWLEVWNGNVPSVKSCRANW